MPSRQTAMSISTPRGCRAGRISQLMYGIVEIDDGTLPPGGSEAHRRGGLYLQSQIAIVLRLTQPPVPLRRRLSQKESGRLIRWASMVVYTTGKLCVGLQPRISDKCHRISLPSVSTFSLNRDSIALGRTKGGIYTIGLFLGIKVLSFT